MRINPAFSSSFNVIGRSGELFQSHAPDHTPSAARPEQLHVDPTEPGLPSALFIGASGVPRSDAVDLLENTVRHLDALNGEAMAAMPHDAQQVSLGLVGIAEHGANEFLQRSQSAEHYHSVLQQAASFVRDTQNADENRDLTFVHRASALMDFVRRFLSNEFEQDSLRWTSNVVNVAIRTGLIVGITTILRQLVGFYIEKTLQLGQASLSTRAALGVASMLLGPVLNLAGFARDEWRGTATLQSRISRTCILGGSIAALAAASRTGDPLTLISPMSSFGPQMVSYTLARDLAQLFAPLESNASSHFSGSLTGNVVYGAVQFGIGEAMDAWAPSSGAGRVVEATRAASSLFTSTSTASDCQVDEAGSTFASTRAVSASPASVVEAVYRVVGALQPDLRQDLTRGLLNAAGETVDDLVRVGFSHAFAVAQTRSAARQEALAEGRNPDAIDVTSPRETEGLRLRTRVRWPSQTQCADQFLTTNAIRTSVIETSVGMAMSAAALLEKTDLTDATQGHLVNAVCAANTWLTYLPFVYAHDQRAPDMQSGSPPASVSPPQTGQEMELRQRRVGVATEPARAAPSCGGMRRQVSSAAFRGSRLHDQMSTKL